MGGSGKEQAGDKRSQSVFRLGPGPPTLSFTGARQNTNRKHKRSQARQNTKDPKVSLCRKGVPPKAKKSGRVEMMWRQGKKRAKIKWNLVVLILSS